MDIDVKTPKYLLYKVHKWWYYWMIFSNDRSIYVENNGKKMKDGIKESESEWKMVIFQGYTWGWIKKELSTLSYWICIVLYERMVNDWSLSIGCLITLSVRKNSEDMDRET